MRVFRSAKVSAAGKVDGREHRRQCRSHQIHAARMLEERHQVEAPRLRTPLGLCCLEMSSCFSEHEVQIGCHSGKTHCTRTVAGVFLCAVKVFVKRYVTCHALCIPPIFR